MEEESSASKENQEQRLLGRADEWSSPRNDSLICPVCGAVVVQEKCKVICRSEVCRGRVIMNCSEF